MFNIRWYGKTEKVILHVHMKNLPEKGFYKTPPEKILNFFAGNALEKKMEKYSMKMKWYEGKWANEGKRERKENPF